MIRLQKYLSQAGICSRRKGEEFILKGLVKVNGQIIKKLGTKIDPQFDKVEVEKKNIIKCSKKIYIALNKPEGYISSCDHHGEKIVLDLIDIPYRIYPVGRLDKESTGLIILTNDGNLHNQLSHPSYDHEKEYDVTVKQFISDDFLNNMRNGMYILGSKTRPARINRISPKRFTIVLQEGKNRQIRRMVNEFNNSVIKLNRIRIGHLKLGSLSTGRWRYLKRSEIKKFLKKPY